MAMRKKQKREERDRKIFARAVQAEIDRRAELQAAMRREGIRLAAEAAGWPLSTAELMIAKGMATREALESFMTALERVQ
jgi:hypothetical protein